MAVWGGCRPSLRRLLLASLIGALSVSALVGIYVVVAGDFGDTQVRILFTTLSLAYFSMTALACAVILERRRALWLAWPGLAVSPAGFVISQLVIWLQWDSQPMAKTLFVLVLFAFSFAHSCLLALASLGPRVRWVFPAAVVCIFSLAGLLSTMVVFGLEDELLFRMTGVAGILDAAATLAVPVLYKLGGTAPGLVSAPASDQPARWQIELACPRCGYRGVFAPGLIHCPECALEIRLSIPEAGTGATGKRLRTE